MSFAKKALVVLVVGFLLFYVITQPEAAAAAVRRVLGVIGMAFSSIFTFFSSLAG